MKDAKAFSSVRLYALEPSNPTEAVTELVALV
jgi:hypothetical protein